MVEAVVRELGGSMPINPDFMPEMKSSAPLTAFRRCSQMGDGAANLG